MAEQDLLDLLREEHTRIEDLFREVDTSEAERRRQAFAQLAWLLSVHETAHEEVVHPVSRRVGAGDEVVDARLGEALDAKELLAELKDMGSDHPDFPTTVEVLRKAVQRHAGREERYEFPHLEQNLPRAERARLGAALLAAQRRIADGHADRARVDPGRVDPG